MKPFTRTVLTFLLANIFLFGILFLICHLRYMADLGADTAPIFYPRLYFLFTVGEYLPALDGYEKWILKGIIIVIVLDVFLLYQLIVKYQGRAIAALFFVSVTVALLLTEIVLRVVKYKPLSDFTSVEQLHEYKGFEADAGGIFKVSSEAQKAINQHITASTPQYLINEEVPKVYLLVNDYLEILNKKIDNGIARLYFSIIQKNESERTVWENAVANYVYCPINKDGFRSIEFKKYKHAKPSVLLLGDSFTWGHSTENKTNSFADILLSKGYVVYNSGISGADVAQYLAIARKYIPELQPDFVVVNFYIGNDISYYKRAVLPYHPIFYTTNAGNLLACPHGRYFENKEAAYRHAFAQIYASGSKNMLTWLCAKSILIHFLWNTLSKTGIVLFLNSDIRHYYIEAGKRRETKPYSNIELREIKNIAERNGAKFILSSIPEVNYSQHKTAQDNSDLFGGLGYEELKVEKSDYNMKDGHFNERGHRKYADFLDSILVREHKGLN